MDNQLVIPSDEELFEMNNGCICCTVRGDLIRILGRLMKRKDRLDGILIETTGLANPAPVAQTFFTDDEMKQNFRLDAIVTVVDAKHVLAPNDDDEASEAARLRRCHPAQQDRPRLGRRARGVEARIGAINAVAKIHRTRRCDVDLAAVLDKDAFNLARILEMEPNFRLTRSIMSTMIRSPACHSQSRATWTRSSLCPGFSG